MPKSMLRWLVVVVFVVALFGFADLNSAIYAQSPTPTPQVIVVTATPVASGASPTFLNDNITAIIVALIALISGVFLSPLLTPIFSKIGEGIAGLPNKLGVGWGFKRRYLTHLIGEYRNLNIRGLRDLGAKTNAVELEHVYVSLQAQSEVALGRKVSPVSVGQALAKHRRLVILGGPGSGKTTLLAYLTLTYARRQAKQRLALKREGAAHSCAIAAAKTGARSGGQFIVWRG